MDSINDREVIMAFHHNTWTRRHFIASVGVSATVMGAAMTFANTALTTDSSKTLSIVVVGGGCRIGRACGD